MEWQRFYLLRFHILVRVLGGKGWDIAYLELYSSICCLFYVDNMFFISVFKEKVWYNVSFRRIFIIFVVGFVSRFFVNSFYDVNVFKEYTSMISLGYYGGMAFFIGFINDLPKISWGVFNLSFIRKGEIKKKYSKLKRRMLSLMITSTLYM